MTAVHAPTPLGRPSRITAEQATAADRERRLSPHVVRELTEAGFAAHFVPVEWGGAAGTFTELFAALVPIAEVCASTAWCAGLWAAHGRFAAYLPSEGQRELWSDSCDIRIAAAVMPPSGTAVSTPNGWTLQGQWDCVSGVDFADWILLAAMVSSEEGSHSRVFAVPRSEATVLDTWHSTGLRGTGSNSVLMAGVFVPAHRTFLMEDLLRGAPGPGRSRCHTIPAQAGGGVIFAAPALGTARSALRAWSEWAQAGSGRQQAPIQTSPSAREALARSAAEIDAAELLLGEAARRADAVDVDDRVVARNQVDVAFAVDLLVTAVERLFRFGGVHARTDSAELQRCWRDVHTVASHGVLRMEPAAAAYAGAVLGA